MSNEYDDFFDVFPVEIREQAKVISVESKVGEFTDNDLLNKRLKELWEAHADLLGVPLGAKLLITEDFVDMLKQWGWGDPEFTRLLTTDHAIASEYRAGGICVTMPDGTWIGGIAPEDFPIIQRMRKAWLDREANS